MIRPKPRVAVLYNSPALPRDHPDFASEASVVDAARDVLDALKTHGFRPFLLAARPPAQRLVNSLVKKHPDLVFNLIEGFGGDSAGEARVTSLLELMSIPYTGCPPTAQGIGRSKSTTKAILIGNGLPTAQAWTVEPGDALPLDPWLGPVIVKPESEDASLGITQASIVTIASELSDRVDSLRDALGPRVMIERYLPGPEFNLGVLALPHPESLPAAEIVYRNAPGEWPILTYEAKWHEGSAADLASLPQCPADIASDLADTLGDLAVKAFRALGCRDYARVDFRLDEDGKPMILEVNPNPDLAPTAGLARAIAASGRDWAETVAALAHQALARGPIRG